jgi:hypothetical protein
VVIHRLQEKRANNFPPIFDHKFRKAVVTRRVDDLSSTKAWTPLWGSILNMSDEMQLKVQAAGTMMAAAAVVFAVKDAMMYAGFSTDEIADRRQNYQFRRESCLH